MEKRGQKIKKFDAVLDSMSGSEREAFLEWWQAVPVEWLHAAASGFDWQALIAEAWAARANKNEPEEIDCGYCKNFGYVFQCAPGVKGEIKVPCYKCCERRNEANRRK